MPDENRQHKLSSEAQEDVLRWLAEGRRNTDIVGRLQREHGVEVTRQAVDYYRNAFADRIDAAREEALQRAAQQGMANRLVRIAVLERNLDRLTKATETFDDPDEYIRLNSELRQSLSALRDELGDLVERHEVTVQQVFEDASRELVTLLRRTLDRVELPDEQVAALEEALEASALELYGEGVEAFAELPAGGVPSE
jgi:hypothetical protein